MLETELLKLSTTIPEFQEKEEIREKIYKTYQITTVHKKFHIRIKPIWIISTAMMIMFVFIGIFHTNRDTIIVQFNYLKKDPTLSAVGELEKHSIVDQVYTVGKQMEYNINDLFSYGLLNQQQLEAVKKYESNLELKGDDRPIFQKKKINSSNFTYRFCIGQKDGNDIIILIDNHSDEEYLIYSSFDLDLGYKQEEMISVYQKHNKDIVRDQNELLQLDCTISNNQAKHTYSNLENCNPVNYILSTDNYKVMSIYANVSASHLNQIHNYYEGYNENSLSYISDLRFEGEEVKDALASGILYHVKPLKERIAGIANKNETMYEIEYSINNSPLLAAYVSKETWHLIEAVRKYTPISYGGKYNTNLAFYYSLLEKEYIVDNIIWIEVEYNTRIPYELDGMYLIEACQYQTITIIRDIIYQQDINYSFTIMIKPRAIYGSNYERCFIDIEDSNFKSVALKYAPRYNMEFFNPNNDEVILRDITGETIIENRSELVDIYNNKKVIRFYDFTIGFGGERNRYHIVYEDYLEQLNNIIVYKKAEYDIDFWPSRIETLVLEDGTIIVLKGKSDVREYRGLLIGYIYYFDYELWIDLVRTAVENYESIKI